MRSDFRQTILAALKNARSSIHVTMYAITDPKIVHALNDKAQEGVEVKIFYDPSATPVSFSPPIQAFPIRGKGLMHRKIVVIDHETVYLGSANLTTSSLMLHSNLSAGFYDKALAAWLEDPGASCKTSRPQKIDDFEAHLEGRLAGPSSADGGLPKRAGEEALDKCASKGRFCGGGQFCNGLPVLDEFPFAHGHAFLLPQKKALAELKASIDGAKKKIHIAMFTLTHTGLVDALIDAKKRGVSVAVALDYYTGRGASAKAAKKLQEAGIKIFLSQGSELLHHKWADIDGLLVLGSTNWTKAAFERNRDILLFLPHLDTPQRRYLEKLWKIIVSESTQI